MSIFIFRIASVVAWIGFLTSACAPIAPARTQIAAAPTPTSEPRKITFETPDGTTLDGTLYGSGTTAVIFSVMGNCKRGWEDMADLVAKNGIMALTYQWRGCGASGSIDEAQNRKFLDDTRGAINFMRAQDATRIILVGASLGGVASAKLAVESQASGIVIIASPPSISQWGVIVEPADLNTDIPKLFITAEGDSTVPANSTHALFDLAAEPKQWQTYPGSAHGTDLFDGESGLVLQQHILEFILTIATEDGSKTSLMLY